jgi:hypothetical protein
MPPCFLTGKDSETETTAENAASAKQPEAGLQASQQKNQKSPSPMSKLNPQT